MDIIFTDKPIAEINTIIISILISSKNDAYKYGEDFILEKDR